MQQEARCKTKVSSEADFSFSGDEEELRCPRKQEQKFANAGLERVRVSATASGARTFCVSGCTAFSLSFEVAAVAFCTRVFVSVFISDRQDPSIDRISC